MVNSACQVVLRARPPEGASLLNYLPDKKSVAITQSKSIEGRPGQQGPPQTYQFKFDNVLNNASQEDVYEVCGSDIVRRALRGFNGTIMAYGQTGAGKTYTMSGGRQSYKQRGIIPRTVSQIFSELRAMPDVDPKISIQYLEIYNEALYDLLDITTQPHEIQIYESAKGVVSVQGLKTAVVATESEALALLFEGETNRVIGEHQLNRESSRSHSIFTVTLELRPAGEGGGDVLVSKLALVDLAGSERVSKTKSEGLVLREAGHINKSLSILEQVILGLSEKNRDHVPFRSSKLTHVLKNSLGGNCHTVLVANVWGEAGQTEETLSTARFAQRMMRVTCEITANVVQDSSAKVRQLERQVAELQQELAMHDAMSARGGTQYTSYSDGQRADLRRRVLDFLMAEGAADSGIEPLELNSIRHMREILYACRHVFQEARAGGAARPPGSVPGAAAAGASAGRPGAASAAAGAAPARTSQQGARPPDKQWPEYTEGVGDVDGREQAGGAGVAPDNARPAADGDGGSSSMEERLLSAQSAGTSGAAAAAAPAVHLSGPPPDKRQALEDYRSGPGAAKSQLLAENRAKLRSSRKHAKELGLAVNGAKRELDALKSREEALKKQRADQGGDGAQVLDAEEYDALMRIKELKGQYREHYNDLQVVKSEVDYTQGLVDQCAKELVLEFNAWYIDSFGVPSGLQDLDLADDDGGPNAAVSGGGAAAAAGAGTPKQAAAGGAARAPPRAPLSIAGSQPRGGGAGAPDSPSGASSASSPASKRLGGTAAAAAKAKAKPPVPLASLIRPSGTELADPEAMAYYNAQQVLLAKTVGVAHRPGSVKKNRSAAAFGASGAASGRSDITDRIVPDVAMALHPGRK